jgi:hypothetical protein
MPESLTPAEVAAIRERAEDAVDRMCGRTARAVCLNDVPRLCDTIAAQAARIELLEAENARLTAIENRFNREHS